MGLTYNVVIRRRSDGAERTCPSDWEWCLDDTGQPELYWWEDGNGACDCNRAQMFAAAGGEPDPNHPCGSVAYVIVRYELADGTVVSSGEVPDIICLDDVRGHHRRQPCSTCGTSTVGVVETWVDGKGNRKCHACGPFYPWRDFRG